MTVDWKHCAGYVSLKAAYVKTVQGGRSFSSKQELYERFQWVLGRAKYYAHKEKRAPEKVLNQWEKDRTYSWVNYYQDMCQPKHKARRNSYSHPFASVAEAEQFCSATSVNKMVNKILNKKRRPRWSNERKAREKRMRGYKESVR